MPIRPLLRPNWSREEQDLAPRQYPLALLKCKACLMCCRTDRRRAKVIGWSVGVGYDAIGLAQSAVLCPVGG